MTGDRLDVADLAGLPPEVIVAIVNEYLECQKVLQAHGWRCSGQPLIDAIRGLLPHLEQ